MILSGRGRLILIAGSLVLIAAITWAAYTDPNQAHVPLVTFIPVWIVLAATVIGSYLWEHKKRQEGRPAWHSARQRLEVLA